MLVDGQAIGVPGARLFGPCFLARLAALTGSDPFDSATAITAAARCEPCSDPCFGPPGSRTLITGMIVIAVFAFRRLYTTCVAPSLSKLPDFQSKFLACGILEICSSRARRADGGPSKNCLCERVQHESPHCHVRVVGEACELLAEPFAEAERELNDFLSPAADLLTPWLDSTCLRVIFVPMAGATVGGGEDPRLDGASSLSGWGQRPTDRG